MKKTTIFILFTLVFVIAFCSISSNVALSESISDKVFRLHIIANSDSHEDQELKLKVRDEILKNSRNVFSSCNSVDEAICTANSSIQELCVAANKVIANNGFKYSSKAIVTKQEFDTRYYDGFVLPAGEYNCLKIVLGEGKGHNWWCVLYPSVCISGCVDDFDAVLNDREKEFILKDKYKFRFKAIEIYESIKSKITS